MGRYTLEGSGGAKILVLRLQSITPRNFAASAPLGGPKGSRIRASFPTLGTLRATISRTIDGGFCADIDADEAEMRLLASRIEWLKKRTYNGASDNREHGRFMPREPRSVVIHSCGTVTPCLIIDLSASGAAVSADIDAPLGTVLAIGRAVGRVVRKLDAGFAVQFIETYDPETVEDRIRPCPTWYPEDRMVG